MKLVKFVKPWSKWSPGDVAGFDPEQAQHLIDAKTAEAHEPEPEAKPAKAAK